MLQFDLQRPDVYTDPNVRFSKRLRHMEAPALPPADVQV